VSGADGLVEKTILEYTKKDSRRAVMTKDEFRKNFITTIKELNPDCERELDQLRFFVIPIQENVNYNSKDDFMRLSLDNIKNMAKNEFTLDKLVQILTPISPLYPLWIALTYKNEEQGLIEVRLSLGIV